MRHALIISAAMAIFCAGSALAADDPWRTYVSREDRFAFNVPGEPQVESFTYTSEYGSSWAARTHIVAYEGYLHRMTVVDMSTDRSDRVPPGFERRGAMVFAAANLRQTGETVLDTYDQVQVIPGHKLEIMLENGAMNLVELHIYDELLYILECISPADGIPAYDVQSSLEILNADLIVPRFENAGFPGPVPVAATEERAPSAIAGAIDYVSEADRFAIALPVEPTVEGFTYTSAQYSPWAARRYTAELDGHTYRMTVVDMTTSRLREGVDAFRNTARPGSERSGALAHAAWNLRMTGTVSVDSYVERQAIPGIRLEIALPGGERNLAEIYEHNDYLYILEDLEAPITTEGIEIHASLQLLDTDGNVPTYVDDGRTFPDYFEIVGDGTGAAGRDTGAIAREQAPGQ